LNKPHKSEPEEPDTRATTDEVIEDSIAVDAGERADAPAQQGRRIEGEKAQWIRRHHELWFSRLFTYAASRLTDSDAAAEIVHESFLATTLPGGRRSDFAPETVIQETVRRVRRARGVGHGNTPFHPGQPELDEDVLALRLGARLADGEIANALGLEIHEVWLIVLAGLSKIRDRKRSRPPTVRP
jgi:DNA-directed RNA polymerase specialized sigma24 family protein